MHATPTQTAYSWLPEGNQSRVNLLGCELGSFSEASKTVVVEIEQVAIAAVAIASEAALVAAVAAAVAAAAASAAAAAVASVALVAIAALVSSAVVVVVGWQSVTPEVMSPS